MATINQTDTVDGPTRAAYNTGLTVNGDTTGRKASYGGTLGSGAYGCTIDASANNKACLFMEIAIPAGWSIGAGTWTINVNCTTAATGCTITSAYLRRLSSGNADQGAIGSSTGLSIDIGTTGVKQITITGSAQTLTAGDKVELIVGMTNPGGGGVFFGWTANQTISAPFFAVPIREMNGGLGMLKGGLQ